MNVFSKMYKTFLKIISGKGFYEALQHRFNRRKYIEDSIEDIYDGSEYRQVATSTYCDAIQWRQYAFNHIKIHYVHSQINFYRKLCQAGGFLTKSSNNITFKLNTDGISVFNSSTKDLWPIILQINELPPSMRFVYFNCDDQW